MSKQDILRTMTLQGDGYTGAEVPRIEDRIRHLDPERETLLEKCHSNPDHLLRRGEPFCRHCEHRNSQFTEALGRYDEICKRLQYADINLAKNTKKLEESRDTDNAAKKIQKREESVRYWTDMRNARLQKKQLLAQELAQVQS